MGSKFPSEYFSILQKTAYVWTIVKKMGYFWLCWPQTFGEKIWNLEYYGCKKNGFTIYQEYYKKKRIKKIQKGKYSMKNISKNTVEGNDHCCLNKLLSFEK